MNWLVIDLRSYRSEKMWSGKIELERGTKDLYPQREKDNVSELEEEHEALSKIIRELNDRFGTNFTEKDQDTIAQLEERIDQDKNLAETVDVATSKDKMRVTFDLVINDMLEEIIDSNFKFYRQITDDKDFANRLLAWLFERYLKREDEKTRKRESGKVVILM